MLAVIEKCSEDLVRVTARNRLSRSDYAKLAKQLEQSIAEYPSNRCWIELAAFDGVEPGALVDVNHCQVNHCRAIRRCAIVGDWVWSVCLVALARAIFPEAEVKYFERRDREEANEWISFQPAEAELAVV